MMWHAKDFILECAGREHGKTSGRIILEGSKKATYDCVVNKN